MALKKPELKHYNFSNGGYIRAISWKQREQHGKKSKVLFFYQTKRLHAKLLLIWTSTIGDNVFTCCLCLIIILFCPGFNSWMLQALWASYSSYVGGESHFHHSMYPSIILLAFFQMDWELVVSCKSCALHCVLLSPR